METERATKGIIDGFQDDFNGLVEDFIKTSPRFRLNDFFKFWNDRSLDCLLANRFDPRELLEAITEMNQVLVQTIITQSMLPDDRPKLLALYFLICLYAKQPIRLRRKIRLTCDDAVSIQRLCDRAHKDLMHTDAGFSWNQLRKMEAIELVEERQIYGPSMLARRSGKKISGLDANWHLDLRQDEHSDTLAFLEGKIGPILGEIQRLSAPYDELKNSMNLNDYNDPTVDIESSGTLAEFIDQAKTLFYYFKIESG